MQNQKTKALVQGAVIAAMYAALTYAASAANLAYGNVQFRFSEALTVLAAFTPAAIPGLAIGCFLGNLGSPYGMVDIVCGTLATLFAALCAYAVRNVRVKKLPLLSMFFPVLFNGLIVGAEVTLFLPEGFTFYGFLINALWVALGESVVCYVGGVPISLAIKKTGIKKLLK